jgi:PKD repeat protein
MNPTSGSIPLQVANTSTSTGSITSWSWSFCDGVFSSPQSLNHTYIASGNYMVRLTATGSGGSDTITKSITVSMPGNNLVAAFSFDEGGGTTVADVSGNTNNGTISGATWTSRGKYGKALSFDGVNDWVTVTDTPALDLTTGRTLEAWVYPTTTTGVRDILIKEGANIDIYNLYARNWLGLPESNVFVNGSNHTAQGTALPTNVWTHVAGTYDGAMLRLFINGVQAASTPISSAIAISTGPLRMGGNSI